jgi:hypothetical protein
MPSSRSRSQPFAKTSRVDVVRMASPELIRPASQTPRIG